MKNHTAFLSTVIVVLSIQFSSPSATLKAQTNFVKYDSGNPVLPLGAPGTWDDTEAAYAQVYRDAGGYQMWYSGAPQDNIYRIGYATSVDGINWEKYSSNPVLSTAATGFDNASAWQPMVLFYEDQYEMWYAGNLNAGRIGYATSDDAVTWTRHGGNPVLTEGGSGAWDQNFVFNPVVLRSDTLYQMWYAGTNQSVTGVWQTGYATSTDGINWSKHATNPVLQAGASGEWDSGGAIAGSVLFEDGLYHMWYFNWSSTITGLDIGYATSPDGINWTKFQGNPILTQQAGDWDADNTNFPRVIKEGHRWRMWYTGRRSGSIDRLCYAEDFSNAAHVDSIWVSPQSIAAGLNKILIQAHIANPHRESLTVRALIVSEDGSINEFVDMVDPGGDDGNGWTEWEPPAEGHRYSVGVELNITSAGYIHNSFDWGVLDEFSANLPTHTFAEIAEINDGDGGAAHNLIMTRDSTILLANGPDGLRSYAFNGNSFLGIAHVNDGGSAMGVEQASDGTVFVANGDDGLRAYGYDGSTFTSLAHIDEGGSATALALASDGTIFLANGDDGLRAYTYNGISFINTAQINSGGSASDISVAPDGTVFLANGSDGLRVYDYNGASFTNTAHADDSDFNDSEVALAADGTVFLANSVHGLRAYNYDGVSLTLIAQINPRDWAQGLAIADDGTIFLVCRSSVVSPGSLYSYTFDGTSFTINAYLHPLSGLTTRDATVVANGTVFIANGERGLIAFSYAPVTTTSVEDTPSKLPDEYVLLQNYPNPFNPTTIIGYTIQEAGTVELKIYNTLGQEIRTLVNAVQTTGTHQVVWDGRDQSGNPVAAGLYFYRVKSGSFVETRKMLLIR